MKKRAQIKKAEVVLKKLNKKKYKSISTWLYIGSKYDSIKWWAVGNITVGWWLKYNIYKKEKSNFKEAIKWYKRAHVLGESKASYRIGILYREGDQTLKRDYSKSFEWFL